MKNLLDWMRTRQKSALKTKIEKTKAHIYTIEKKQKRKGKKREREKQRKKRFMYAMCNVFSFCFRAIQVALVWCTTAYSPFLILINFEGIKNSSAYMYSFSSSCTPNNPYTSHSLKPPNTNFTRQPTPEARRKWRANEKKSTEAHTQTELQRMGMTKKHVTEEEEEEYDKCKGKIKN